MPINNELNVCMKGILNTWASSYRRKWRRIGTVQLAKEWRKVTPDSNVHVVNELEEEDDSQSSDSDDE